MTEHSQNPRAAILARCSSVDNVCSQVLTLRQYARDKYLVDEEDVYGDNIRGSSPVSERVELQRLMRNVEQGSKKYDVVLVQDPSRISKTEGAAQELVQWFASKGVPVVFVDNF